MPETCPEPSGKTAEKKTRIALWICAATLLFTFHLAMNVWWLLEDNHTIRTDEEGHMQWARMYYEALFLDDDASLMQRLVAVSQIKLGNPAHPPLLHIIGSVFIALLGYRVGVLALVNSAMFLATLLASLLILQRFLDRWKALYAVFVVSFLPLMYAASRFFMTDYVSLALVVWAVYALLRTDLFRNSGWVFLFAVLNGLGFLARPTTFLYYFLPCLCLVLAGWCTALFTKCGGAWRVLLLNCLMTAVVSVGIASPWYFRNLPEYHRYWMSEHSGSAGGPVVLLDAKVPPKSAPASPGQDNAAPEAAPPLVSKSMLSPILLHMQSMTNKVFKPSVRWTAYPMHAINDAVFLPTFVLCVIGMALALLLPGYRSWESLLLLLWLGGSYFLMTVIFKFSTARYVLPAAPALGIFAALTVMAPKNALIRRAAMTIFALLLLFQYFNLTMRPCGAYAELKLGEKTIYKDYLSLGFSYTRLSCPNKENYKDDLFEGMIEAERRQQFPKGDWAYYARLRTRGMEFDEMHYWRQLPGRTSNPFRKASIPPDKLPVRRLRSIEWASEPEDLAPRIDNLDYVVYMVDSLDEQQQQEWVRFFAPYGFHVVNQLQWPRFGKVPPRYFGILARFPDNTPPKILAADEVDALGLRELYDLKCVLHHVHDPQYESMKTHLSERLRAQVAALPTGRQVINEYLDFVAAEVIPLEPEWYSAFFIFDVKKLIEKDYRIFFHGLVEEPFRDMLPPQFRKEGCIMWNFNPAPPTSEWAPGEYVFLTHRIHTAPIPYALKVGFFTGKSTFFGTRALLGKVDFSTFQGGLLPATPPNS